MQKTLLNIFKKILLILGVIFVIVLNLYISHFSWDIAFVKLSHYDWYWDLTRYFDILIFPPLHHFEWNTLKPNNHFVLSVWNMIKTIIRNAPTYGTLYLLGNAGVYSIKNIFPTKINLLMLPLNYFKVTILAYWLTIILTIPIDFLLYFEVILPEQSVSFAGPMYSHVFWLSIFFAWRQISLRDKPRKKFHLPSFPKVSPSPTL